MSKGKKDNDKTYLSDMYVNLPIGSLCDAGPSNADETVTSEAEADESATDAAAIVCNWATVAAAAASCCEDEDPFVCVCVC